MRPIILDVDTGNDDAVAIAMAVGASGLDVLGCTTALGNLTLSQTTDNTLRTLDALGRSDVPVYAGRAKPLVPRPYPFAPGRSSGLMHEATLPLAAAGRGAAHEGAVDWIVSTLRAATEPITIVAVAPLTNIAAAVIAAPDIVEHVDELVIMGGGHEFGNRTPAAEFNIYADPTAADVVFQAGFERTVVMPLDATHDVVMDRAMLERLDALGTPGGSTVAAVLDFYITGHDLTHPMEQAASAPVHDALCIAYLMDPEVVELRHVHASVDTTSFHNYGRTTVDVNQRLDAEPNIWWAFSADQARFDRALLSSLQSASSNEGPGKK
ncbi:nucleoside hydrolase [Agrococcus sp. HG114]|uniref:nucleoside hydrolase n=1 Tax=Agrococcus sp. HG114 TaxID=2969757 RepID=UPI00215B3FAF|nr:nucleoside hydrolase [Agrococcus sp. HG114]MCR8669561.1 nucleoside hydrolase [Agrococcus sp. HG114]